MEDGADVAGIALMTGPGICEVIVGSRAHLHLEVNFCIAPHLERCT